MCSKPMRTEDCAVEGKGDLIHIEVESTADTFQASDTIMINQVKNTIMY
jgi:hypothetical protein